MEDSTQFVPMFVTVPPIPKPSPANSTGVAAPPVATVTPARARQLEIIPPVVPVACAILQNTLPAFTCH